jgi:hypothetical protein
MRNKIIYSSLLLFACAILYAATGNESVTLTSSVERRNQEPYIKPVWERVVTATHDGDDTGDVTQALNLNGLLRKVVLTVPSFTNSITGQVVIKDNGDNTIFDSGEQTKGSTYTFNVDEPLSGTVDVVIGVSGAAGGTGGSIVVTLRGI